MKISAQASYGFLGLPLAMAALPVYVQIPAFYTTQLGMPLAATGLVLFFARLVDTVQDPLLGRMIDQRQQRIASWMLLAAFLLALSFYGLWLPPVAHAGTTPLLAWLGLMLIVAYTAHSMINIAYLSWGARLGLSSDSNANAHKPPLANGNRHLLGAAAWREGLGLVGVILASLIPSFILADDADNINRGLTLYAIGFAVLLATGIAGLLLFAPKWRSANQATISDNNTGNNTDKNSGNPLNHSQVTLREAFGNLAFRRLLPIYFLNSLSVSIPATLALFFINDRIQAPQLTGYFLAIYFFAGAAGLPAWIVIAQRIGTVAAWKTGMLLAILSFVGASFLNSGDIGWYVMVCVASGLALGADLALPPVLLAEIIPPHHAPASYYGIWTLLGKLALAISGLALPLLSLFHYQPGQATHSGNLVMLYAALPCLLKLLAMRSLYRYSS